VLSAGWPERRTGEAVERLGCADQRLLEFKESSLALGARQRRSFVLRSDEVWRAFFDSRLHVERILTD
jgi:hypothetical protein